MWDLIFLFMILFSIVYVIQLLVVAVCFYCEEFYSKKTFLLNLIPFYYFAPIIQHIVNIYKDLR